MEKAGVDSFCCACCCADFPCYTFMNRRALIKKYNINEGCCCSWATVCCCYCTSSLQMVNEVLVHEQYTWGWCSVIPGASYESAIELSKKKQGMSGKSEEVHTITSFFEKRQELSLWPEVTKNVFEPSYSNVFPAHVMERETREENDEPIGQLRTESGKILLTSGMYSGSASKREYGAALVSYKQSGFILMCPLEKFVDCAMEVCGCPAVADSTLGFVEAFCGTPRLAIPSCCCLPQIKASDAQTQNELGTAKFVFGGAVPKVLVLDEKESVKYKISPDTVCCGNFVKPAGKSGCVENLSLQLKGGSDHQPRYTTFFIRDPSTEEKLKTASGEPAVIQQVYSGPCWPKICSGKQKVECNSWGHIPEEVYASFPVGATPTNKAVLLGANLLIKSAVFDKNAKAK